MQSQNKLPIQTKTVRAECGAAVVEFALLLILLLIITGGIIEFGRTLWHYDALTKATRDGARYMSLADKADIQSVQMAQAKNLVMASANAAGISPALTASNVVVTCLNDSYQSVSCVDGTAPANIKVEISGYSATFIGEWMPLFNAGGNVHAGMAPLFQQHTTMRYMK